MRARVCGSGCDKPARSLAAGCGGNGWLAERSSCREQGVLIASLSRSQRLTLLSRQQLTALLGHIGQQNAGQIKLEDGLEIARRDQAAVAKLSEAVFAPSVYDSLNERGFLRIWNYEHGYLALRHGRAEESLNHFRAALQHRAAEWNIDSFEDCLANAFLALGRNDEAIAEYERILKINPHYPLAHYHLAQQQFSV